MQVGIVGMSGVGKTTLFNTLTGLDADTGLGGKRKVNTGVIDVPDPRIDQLAEMWNPKKVIYARIQFTDVPGSQARGALDSKALEDIRPMDALAVVVRAFESPMLAAAPNPAVELSSFEDELMLADLSMVEKRLDRMRKEKGAEREKAALEKCSAWLEDEKPLRELECTPEELSQLSGYRFLSIKPIVVVLNVVEEAVAEPAPSGFEDYETFVISAALEGEIGEMEPDEQELFLADLGLEETARGRFIRAAYSLLDLISFLTVGDDECRAWSIQRGTHARRAARTIHSDLERGFIRAEVIGFADYVSYGSEAACRDAGVARLEGKEYVVKDGDVMHIRANV
jgi:GTP-binding protein YchF